MREVILLSGCNGGIGKSICRCLLKEYKVYGLDIGESSPIEDENFHYIQANITSKEDVAAAIKEIKEERVQAIVTAAGIFYMESIVDGDEDNLKKIIDVNFYGTYNLIRAAFPKLSKNSRIVILTSEVARYSPQPFMGYYTLSKHLVDCYADVLRRECAYLGIKVSKIQSGSISTGLLSKVTGQYDELLNSKEEFKAPLRKFRGLMLSEINKKRDPIIIGKLVAKIVKSKKPKGRYRIKNSPALRMLNLTSESFQDTIYTKFIK